jgi:steroid 5-alpha reductase family enzyme
MHYAYAFALAATIMAALWWRQQHTRDAGIVDIGWAGCLALVAPLFALVLEGPWERRVMVALLGAVWGARLSGYLAWRNRGRAEDGRYAKLRERWGTRAPLYFFVFFQVQASWVLLFSLPFSAAMNAPRGGLDAYDFAGVALWLVAIAGEAVADAQLARFRADPANRGRTCRAGLWRYSRHPNYFFEWVHWFAYVAIAGPTTDAWGAWMGPVVMLAFLYKVTGIPYTEAQSLRSRGDDYRRYQAETSAFIPWFPKRAP